MKTLTGWNFLLQAGNFQIFSVINDPHDQEQRFTDQVEQKKAGDNDNFDDYIPIGWNWY